MAGAMMAQRTMRWAVLTVALLVAVGLRVTNANPAVAQAIAVASVTASQDPGLDPASSVWDEAPSVDVPFTAQQVTFPLGGGSVPVAEVRSVNHENVLYIRMAWADSSVDSGTTAVEDFADAAAIQFPSQPASSVPAVCMGQADLGVNIWQWRADSQAGIDDLPPTEHGYVDLYTSTEDLFFPARAAGNVYAVGSGPVQNLVAGGFGTLTPVDEQVVMGSGVHDGTEWSVVFARPFPAPGSDQPAFADGQEIDVAFAIWNGSADERDGLKSVSGFLKLEVGAVAAAPTPPAAAPLPDFSAGSEDPELPWAVLLLIFGSVAVLAIAIMVATRPPKQDATE